MAKIKRVKVLSLAYMHALVFGFLGLLAGLAYGVGGIFVDLFTTGLNRGTALALNAIIIMPLSAAVCGFVFGVFAALLFNFISRFWKGLRLEF